MARPRKAVPTASQDVSDELVTVECIVHNVWTSKGKMWRGDIAEIPASDLPLLDGKVIVA